MAPSVTARLQRLTDDATEAQYLSDVSDRDRRWDVRRRSGETVEEIFRDFPHPTFAKWSPRLKQCAQVLEFGWSPDARFEGVLSLKLKRTWFCKVPMCPVCMWRKSLVKLARLYTALPELTEDFPNHKWIFLTLTVKNVPVSELREELKQLHASYKRLTKREEWKRGIVGWLRSTEVTKGRDGGMRSHPHIHTLAFVKSSYFSRHYVTQDRWRELWADCARLDYDPQVDVRKVKPSKKSIESDGFEPGLRSAIAETMKYVVKPADLSLSNQDYVRECAVQLRKVRMMAVGGVLRSYMKDTKPEQQDLVLGDGDGEGNEKNPGGVRYGWRADGSPRYSYKG